jgi:hypothetical protein
MPCNAIPCRQFNKGRDFLDLFSHCGITVHAYATPLVGARVYAKHGNAAGNTLAGGAGEAGECCTSGTVQTPVLTLGSA